MSETTVYMWPKTSPHNKYAELLSRSLERRGWRVAHFDRRTMRRPGKGDIVHMHWPSNSYQSSSFPLTVAKSLLFLALLSYYRLRGVRLFWTIHNIWPHRGPTRWDRAMRKRLLRLCEAAFVLGEAARREAAAAFGIAAERLIVTPHGHYVGAYEAKGTDIRARFDIPADRYLFLFIGRIAPYKGIEQLVEAWRSPALTSGALLIAGQAEAGYDLGFAAAEKNDAIRLFPSFVDDGELADFLAAADAVVLPYRQITTSGSAILALSCGKPVVAPRLGTLPDYVPEGGGVLYDPDDPQGLRAAMLACMALDRREARQRIAVKLRELDWGRIAAQMTGVYRPGGQSADHPLEVRT